MGIPRLGGRDFSPRDDAQAPQVAIVSQEFARQFFPNQEVVGKHLTFGPDEPEVEIVGLVADTKYMDQREEISPLIYTPWRQELKTIGEMSFALRTTTEPTALANTVRRAVHEIDPGLPVTDITSQTARAAQTLSPERLYARLLSFFGLLALLLAAIGLSGVLAYSVAQRTNEIGIRMALGAQPGNVLRLVTWQGMKLVVFGLTLGALSGYTSMRLLTSQYFADSAWQNRLSGIGDQLYGVKGTDPLTFAAIATVLLLVSLVACWLPARKAAQVDPLEALRYE